MDESWDDITFDDLADQPDETEEPETAETEAEAEQKPEAEEPVQETEEQDQLFELKHLDETKSVGREEVIALAQKGMDYDRVRQKYDAAKPAVEWYEKNADTVKWLEEMASEQNMSLAEMVDETRAEIMARKTNQSVSVCRGIVANERKAMELDAQKKAMESRNQDDRIGAEVKEFLQAYPDVGPNIPQEVWDAVNGGSSLINAYRAYENKQLKAQLEKEKTEAQRRAQEEKNKARSTGSQSTAGKRSDMDAFDAAWYDGD